MLIRDFHFRAKGYQLSQCATHLKDFSAMVDSRGRNDA